jgi:ATP-dependent helicase HrpA
VAETSLTVPGIRYVVDTGQARVKRYSLRNKIEQLKIEKIAQAAANQRAGRCGRVAAGVCIRLYDEPDFLARPGYTTPELLRSSLAGVILRMKSLGLPDIEAFPFLDPPESRRVRDGQQLLVELGALDEAGRLTTIGRQLAHLPLDPRIGRMLIAARDKACLHEMLVIAAYLSVQDPRDRPLDQQEAADQKHRRFVDANSDFVTLLNLWRHVDELNIHRKSQRKFRDALKADFLSPNRVREWRDVYGQLTSQVKELGWKVGAPLPQAGEAGAEPRERKIASGHGAKQPLSPGPSPAGGGGVQYAPLHQALLPGLLGNLGMLTEDGAYLGARDMKFAIFPGSGVKKKPKWVMAAEIVETRRVYARTVAKIEPEWVEHAARHLLKISYGDPHWAKKPAHVAAAMRATLYGLPVVNGRQVHYGPIDPEKSRELFIRGALVEGEYDSRAPFFLHNRRLLEEIDDLAHRSRNARLTVDEHALFRFFDERIPAGMHNGAAFEKWRREAERNRPRLLFLERESLLAGNQRAAPEDFPPAIEYNGVSFPLAYRFDPGTPDDGVTLVAALAALNQIPAQACEWLVPGLLEQKIAALIKTLPQSIRRTFVPVPDYARAAKQALSPPASPATTLIDALAAFLTRATGAAIPRDAWRPEALPAHLAMNFRVVDEKGKVLAEGRDLGLLRGQLGGAASLELARSFAESSGRFEREKLARWDFGDLPETVEVLAGQRQVAAFPALECVAGEVRLTVFDNPDRARAAHGPGVARLIWLQFPDLLRQAERDLAGRLKTACLQYGLLFKGARCEDLARDILGGAAMSLIGPEIGGIRDQAAFQAACAAARPRLPESVDNLTRIASDSLAAAQRIAPLLARAPAAWKTAVADIGGQLAELVFPGFMARHPAARLVHLPRYLKAAELRLGKLANQAARDMGAMNEMAGLLKAYRVRLERLASQGLVDPALEDFRWRLEELRVSLFAQELRTPEPVSVKRLEKRWAEIAG